MWSLERILFETKLSSLGSNVYNYTIQYVDDSTNMLSSENIDTLEIYVNNYFKLLETFYNIN